MNKKILIAGTRLTGDNMHIGTYYGWIYQIKRALENYDVIIMISDYQSFDNDYDCYYYDVAMRLKKYIKKFLPNVPVIIESDIENIAELGFLINKNFKPRYYKRVMPIRKNIEDNQSISFHTLLYPSMMLADIFAISAGVMFDKPEGKFQHSEVINNMIDDINKKFSINYPFMEIFHKQKINILSLDGTGPMKRNRLEHGLIEVNDLSYEQLFEVLIKCDIQVVKSILDSLEIKYQANELNSVDLIKKLSKKIYHDVMPVDSMSSFTEDEILVLANKNVLNFINLLKSNTRVIK